MLTKKASTLTSALQRTFCAGFCTVALGLFATGAQADVVYSDNFDSNAVGLDSVPAGWSVSDGTVDIKGPGLFDLYPGNGSYVDLDGSTFDAGALSQSFSLTGGVMYNANFTLGGSKRGDTNVVDVSFGSVSDSFSLAANDPLTLYTLAFTPAASGDFSLSFMNQGGDNSGALLLDVAITNAVPEPETYALMLAGLGMLAAVGRRRLKNPHA